MICPLCGAREGEKPFIGPVCVDCYKLKCTFPSQVYLDVCSHCGKVRLYGKWVDATDEMIEKWVLKRCKGKDKPVAYDEERSTLIFEIEGRRIERSLKIRWNKKVCPQCCKISGGYYEAIVQLRGSKHRVKKWLRRLLYLLRKRTFISQVEELKEGIDIYVGESKAVVAVLKDLGFKYEISRKLHTMKQGKRLYRTTFLLRFDKKKKGKRRG